MTSRWIRCVGFIVLGASLAQSLSAEAFNQLSVVAHFNGDTVFAQPTRGISETNREPREVVSGAALVESVSGYIFMPAGTHVLKAQLVNNITDPVHAEVLATLDYTLTAVTPEGCFYVISLRSPARVPDLKSLSVLVLRDDSRDAKGEVTAMLNIVQSQ